MKPHYQGLFFGYLRRYLLGGATAYGLTFISALLQGTNAQTVNVHSPYPYRVAQKLTRIQNDSSAYSSGISSNGIVAGVVQTAPYTVQAAVWTNNRYTYLGRCDGVEGVNNYSVVAGQILVAGKGGLVDQAALFANGKITQIANAGGYNQSVAGGINDSGSVVGSYNYYDSNRNLRGTLGFLYQNGNLTLLNSPVPNQKTGVATGINNNGLIIGYANFPTGSHAATYSGGQWHDLGALGPAGSISSASSVNSQGWVVGFYAYAYNDRNGCFLYKDGKMTDLGIPNVSPSSPSNAYINDQGQVVAGDSLYTNGKVVQIASLLDPKGHWLITGAVGISNQGTILATGQQLDPLTGSPTYTGTVLIEPAN